MSKLIRVAHVISHPIQYYVHLYRAISLLPDIHLTVYYLSDRGVNGYFDSDFQKQIKWDIDLLGGYKSVFIESGGGKCKNFRLLRMPDWKFLKGLIKERYDVIWAHGWHDSNVVCAKIITLLHRKAFLIREDQTLLEPRNRMAVMLKKVAFKFLFLGKRSGALFTGKNSRECFCHFGVELDRLFPALHCVDDVFFTQWAHLLKPDRARVRLSFGITDESPVLLFSGKLIDKKQPLRLVEAFANVARKFSCWLLFAGDGPLLTDVKNLSVELGVSNLVIFAGFLNQSQLPRAYAAADLFVLPSKSETWGLVVNEAMHFSLPVIVSDHVGCAPDLVKDGVNGYVVPAMSTEKLTDAIEKLVADLNRRKLFGTSSKTLIQGYTVSSCAKQIAYACKMLT